MPLPPSLSLRWNTRLGVTPDPLTCEVERASLDLIDEQSPPFHLERSYSRSGRLTRLLVSCA